MDALASCWVQQAGEWWPAEAIEFADAEVRVRFLGFPWRPDRWLPMSRSPPVGGADRPESGLSDEAGDEEARVSFDEPPRSRAASRYPRPPSLLQTPSSSSSASGMTPPPPTPSAARRPNAASAWRADRMGIGKEVFILRRGAHERQRGTVEGSRHGYLLVHTSTGARVHARASDLSLLGEASLSPTSDGSERAAGAAAGSRGDPPHCVRRVGAELGQCEGLCEVGERQAHVEGEAARASQPAGGSGFLLPAAGVVQPASHRASNCEDPVASHRASRCENSAASHCASSYEDSLASHPPTTSHCEDPAASHHPESYEGEAAFRRGKEAWPPTAVRGGAGAPPRYTPAMPFPLPPPVLPPRSRPGVPPPPVSPGPALPLAVGSEVVVTRPGVSRARGTVLGTVNGYWTVGLYRGGAPLNVRGRDLVVVGGAGGSGREGGVGGSGSGGAGKKGGEGGRGGGRSSGAGGGSGGEAVACDPRDGFVSLCPSPVRRRCRSQARSAGVGVGSEVEILRGGAMAGRRGVVVRLCNGYSTVHAAEGEEGEIVEMHLRVWELRLHIRDYIGCWCDTLRHLPTTSTPFEGVWVQCDLCSRWCHGECAGLDRTAAEEAESYTCLPCARGGAPPPAVSAPTHTGLSPDAPPRATEGGLAAGKNKTPAARENKTPAAGKNKALPSRGGENKPLPSGKTKTLAAGKDKISVAGKNKTPTAGEDETAVADEEKPSVLNLERLRRPPSSRGEGSLSSIRGGGSPSSVQGRGSPSSLRGGGSPSPPQGEPSGNRTAAVAKRSVQAGATPAQAPVLPGQGTVLVPPGGAPALAPPGEGVADALPVVSLAGGAGRSSGSRGRGGRAISGRGGGRAISGPGGSGGACSGGRDYSWPGEACGPQIAPGRPAVSRKRCAAAAGGDDRQRLGPASEGSPLHGPDSPQLPLPTVEPPMPPRLGYSEGAIPSPARAPRAAAAAACASSSLCRWVLEHGNAELFYAVLLFLDDAWALRAASCVCAGWRRLLDRAAADGAAAIWSASTLTAPRGRGWASLRATRPGDKVHLLPGSFPSPLELSHPLELTGAPGHATHLTGPLILRGSSTAGRVGLLRNLHLSHFYNPAVTLFGGAWRFEGCTIDSSRRTARAVAGVVLRGGASLELVGCTIISASAAVNLCEAGCALTATSSCFRNVKSGVLCERGGSVTVFGCRFDALSGSDVGLRLSADTTGDVRASSASRLGGLWGRMAPPPGVVFVEAAEEDVDVVAVEAGMGGMLLHAAGAPQAA